MIADFGLLIAEWGRLDCGLQILELKEMKVCYGQRSNEEKD